MKNKFIVSTTNNIEGCSISRYIDTICSNIVIGTNIFSDLSASLTDFFGGRSGSYKSKLEMIYNEASKELKQKALNIGANAIIGFKVDFDEISGKDKSMFMVSVSGTACIIDYKEEYFETVVKTGMISQSVLDKEIKRKFIISEINEGSRIKEEWIEFLLENPQIELVENLLNRYLSYYDTPDLKKSMLDFIERYLSLLPKKEITEQVYLKYLTNNKHIKNLINNCNLFNSNKILALCETDHNLAINLLMASSDYYKKSDIETMIEIYQKLTSLPNTGRIEVVKGGFLGKDQEKFICQYGHKNPSDSEHCENCSVNIKGLRKKEVLNIELFKQKIDTLQEMMNKQEN